METAAPADAELVKSAIDGNDDAFTELVRRHKRRMFAMASRFAHDATQVDDICQDIFIRAFRNLRKFRGEAPFEHWLARIGVRVCYDFLRKNRRRRDEVALDATTNEIAIEQPEFARELLHHALGKLSAEERLVITLAELEDRSAAEIASLTGWSEANVRVRAHRARQNLKKILSRHE